MMEFKFKDGETLYIQESSVEYIHIKDSKEQLPKYNDRGQMIKNTWGDIIYEENKFIYGKKVMFKIDIFPETFTRYFYPADPNKTVEEDSDYLSFVEFIKSAFKNKCILV